MNGNEGQEWTVPLSMNGEHFAKEDPLESSDLVIVGSGTTSPARSVFPRSMTYYCLKGKNAVGFQGFHNVRNSKIVVKDQ
jgi:hypothetical protein